MRARAGLANSEHAHGRAMMMSIMMMEMGRFEDPQKTSRMKKDR